MKKIVYGCMIGLSLSSLMSCKKDKDPEENGPSYAAKADDAGARTELDKAYDDIEAVYNSQDYESSSTMRTQAVVLPCGNVSFNKDSFKIVYGGINCGSRMLSGSIDVSLISGDKFSDPDAKLKVVFKDYKVYYNASKQSIVYNGTAYVINGPNGGTLISLFTTAPKTVVHKVRGKLELKFDTLGSSILVREWNLFRKKTYTSDGTKTGITLKVEGDTILDADSYIPGTYTNVSEYGVGRDNYKFVSMLVIPFKWGKLRNRLCRSVHFKTRTSEIYSECKKW